MKRRFISLIAERKLNLLDAYHALIDCYSLDKKVFGKFMPSLKFLNIFTQYYLFVIKFHSTSIKGEPIEASGAILYPRKHKPKGVVEISPSVKSNKQFENHDYSMEFIICLSGMIGICPDIIGCGVTSKLPISYIAYPNTPILSADIRIAAEEYLFERFNYKLSNDSTLFGYSLGGPNVLSLANYYKNHPELNVNVTDIYIGGGFYFPGEIASEELIQHYQENPTSAALPLAFYSMLHYDDPDIDIISFFKEPLKSNYEELLGKAEGVFELTNLLGTNVNDYFESTLIGSLRDKDSSLYKNLVAKNLTYEPWGGNTRISLFHSIIDSYIPVMMSDRLNDIFVQAGAKVKYRRSELGHMETGIIIVVHFIIDGLMKRNWLLRKVAKVMDSKL